MKKTKDFGHISVNQNYVPTGYEIVEVSSGSIDGGKIQINNRWKILRPIKGKDFKNNL